VRSPEFRPFPKLIPVLPSCRAMGGTRRLPSTTSIAITVEMRRHANGMRLSGRALERQEPTTRLVWQRWATIRGNWLTGFSVLASLSGGSDWLVTSASFCALSVSGPFC
jgi:hypothetical protein